MTDDGTGHAMAPPSNAMNSRRFMATAAPRVEVLGEAELVKGRNSDRAFRNPEIASAQRMCLLAFQFR